MTKTCDMADVVLPSSASWREAEGDTVTNTERRVERMRKALDPPDLACDDDWIMCGLARRLGHDWGDPTLEQVWDELHSLSPMHLLGIREILVMHHRDCAMCHVRDDELAAAVERHTDGWSMTHSRVDLS